jgi:hypothetical protein
VVTHRLDYSGYGLAIRLLSNAPELLEAGRISSGRYSRSDSAPPLPVIELNLILDPQRPEEPVPADWQSRLRYMSVGPWLTIVGEPWLHAFADLGHWVAVALVSPSLAQHPVALSRCVCDTFTLNMLMRTGVGLVHASCLVQDGKALLLTGPHNAGKSSTALRLVLNGYSLVSDGMTYVRPGEPQLELLGYPVGEAKLRLDMLDSFPELQGYGEAALVREDTKMVFNLRRALPERVIEESIRPDQIVLCHVERSPDSASCTEPMAQDDLLQRMWPESTFVDDLEVMRSNLAAIRTLLSRARCYRLVLGTDVAGMLDSVGSL